MSGRKPLAQEKEQISSTKCVMASSGRGEEAGSHGAREGGDPLCDEENELQGCAQSSGSTKGDIRTKSLA